MLKPKTLNRIFFLIIVILALIAGFFQASYKMEQRKYKKLKTQCNSYQIIDNQGQDF